MTQHKPMAIRAGLLLVALAAATYLWSQTTTMFKACLFSPVKGKVVCKGQPVVGAVIERSYDWAWKNQQGRDETTTDHNGEFSLPAIYGTMVLGSVLPHEPVIEQTISIRFDGNSYEAWYTNKRDYAEGSELEGKQLNLLCDLTVEPRKHEGGLRGHFGIGVPR